MILNLCICHIQYYYMYFHYNKQKSCWCLMSKKYSIRCTTVLLVGNHIWSRFSLAELANFVYCHKLYYQLCVILVILSCLSNTLVQGGIYSHQIQQTIATSMVKDVCMIYDNTYDGLIKCYRVRVKHLNIIWWSICIWYKTLIKVMLLIENRVLC